jgi:mRNA-degrading endonuclease HigB of HigAB toxin-antitoxin module
MTGTLKESTLTDAEARAEIELSEAHVRLQTAYLRNNREDIRSALMDIEIAKNTLKSFVLTRQQAEVALSKAHERLHIAYLRNNQESIRQAFVDIENVKGSLSRFVRDRNPEAMRDALRLISSPTS